MYKIGIIGCGYIGLSLIKLLNSKYSIIGYDISKLRINELRLIYNNNNLYYTTNHSLLSQCNVFIIAISTNVNKNKQINKTKFLNICKILNKYVKSNTIIILESSIYIGGTRELFSSFLLRDVYVGFSPERISPDEYEDIQNIPKIISGLNTESLNNIYLFYNTIFNNIIKVSTTEVAELCKLYENCFRVINIAYVNEIADLAKEYNIDFMEVLNASKTKPFGFMPFYPSFGIGGSCLPNNPYYLMQNYKNKLPILNKSINLLNKRPYITVQKLLTFNKFLIIGFGYKQNCDKTHLSPILKIYSQLKKNNKDVTIIKTYNITLEFIKQFNCIIISPQFQLHFINCNVIKEYKIKNYGKIYYY